MDRDHRLDAPDNDSLRTIEQLGDRSELTTIYPRPHSEWEGVDIMSRDDREKKQSAERLRISLSLRRWFVVIGLFIPLPFVYISFLVNVAFAYFDVAKLGFLMLPVVILSGASLYGVYRAFKYAYKIFYTHGTKALPFITIQLLLLALSLNAVFLFTELLHTGDYVIDSLIVGGTVLGLSVVYSAFLVVVWSSPKLSSGAKLACVGVLALGIIGATVAAHLL